MGTELKAFRRSDLHARMCTNLRAFDFGHLEDDADIWRVDLATRNIVWGRSAWQWMYNNAYIDTEPGTMTRYPVLVFNANLPKHGFGYVVGYIWPDSEWSPFMIKYRLSDGKIIALSWLTTVTASFFWDFYPYYLQAPFQANSDHLYFSYETFGGGGDTLGVMVFDKDMAVVTSANIAGPTYYNSMDTNWYQTVFSPGDACSTIWWSVNDTNLAYQHPYTPATSWENVNRAGRGGVSQAMVFLDPDDLSEIGRCTYGAIDEYIGNDGTYGNNWYGFAYDATYTWPDAAVGSSCWPYGLLATAAGGAASRIQLLTYPHWSESDTTLKHWDVLVRCWLFVGPGDDVSLQAITPVTGAGTASSYELTGEIRDGGAWRVVPLLHMLTSYKTLTWDPGPSNITEHVYNDAWRTYFGDVEFILTHWSTGNPGDAPELVISCAGVIGVQSTFFWAPPSVYCAIRKAGTEIWYDGTNGIPDAETMWWFDQIDAGGEVVGVGTSGTGYW